jgi:excisionase family DNA binding protein
MKRQNPTEEPLPPWVIPTEAAAHARVDVKTIYRYIENGTLPAVRFGPRCIRIRREDLLALLTPTPEGPHRAAGRKS